MFVTKFNKLPFILLLSFLAISFNLEDASILLLPFRTKSLQKEDDEEDWIEPYQSEDDDWPYVPTEIVFNTSQFLNKWFYNGLNVITTINQKNIESYLSMGNSKLSIEKCDLKKVLTPVRGDNYYKPLNSGNYTNKGENLGNDIFSFIGDLHYKTNIQIGERGDGLNFYFKEEDNNEDLCGSLGFNMDSTLDKTNLITQLKKKNYINEYHWTLKYLVEEDGIIVLGAKPHFFDTNTYFMSQYCEMKAIPTQSQETAWSFQIDEIRIKRKDSDNLILSDKKIDFLPDRGLIIGTDEYKKEIEKLVFNDLISKGICFCEETNFIDSEKKIRDIYYIYYCDRKKFIGNKYTVEKSYFNSFPSLEFYIKETNMTFTLVNDHLFHEIYNRSYFLVAFKKEGNTIWKLGEPFISHFQFTFDQENKIVGFYNPIMPKIDNEEYMKEKEGQNPNNNSYSKKTIIIIIVVSVIAVLGLGVGAFFLGKKLNEIRKKRANELRDDFEYISDSINGPESTEKNQDNDILGIEKN